MTNQTKNKLLNIYKSIGIIALTMNHYELHEEHPDISLELWREFLVDTEISTYINSELNLLRRTELAKLTNNISNSHSVGQAQIINAMQKVNADHGNAKEGPAYIYCYIPLSPPQEAAENVIKLEEDPFLKINPL